MKGVKEEEANLFLRLSKEGHESCRHEERNKKRMRKLGEEKTTHETGQA